MNKIIRKIIASLFISSTAFLWTACSDDSTNNTTGAVSVSSKARPAIDIENAIPNLERRDTTGLIGTTVSGYDACITRIITNERSDYFFLITERGESEAGDILKTQISGFLESSEGASLSDDVKKCYTSVKNLLQSVPLESSVALCSSYAEELTIDNQNINDLLEADEMSRQAFKSTLERVDELLAECESPE